MDLIKYSMENIDIYACQILFHSPSPESHMLSHL